MHLVCHWWRSACKCHLWLLLEILPWTPHYKHRPPSHLCGSRCQREQMRHGPSLCWTCTLTASGTHNWQVSALVWRKICWHSSWVALLLWLEISWTKIRLVMEENVNYLGHNTASWPAVGSVGGGGRRWETMRRRFLVCLFLVSTPDLNWSRSSGPCQKKKNKLLKGALFGLWPPWFVWGQRRSKTL